MRSLLRSGLLGITAVAVLAPVAVAEECVSGCLGFSVAEGIAIGGGGDKTTTRLAPVWVTGQFEVNVSDQPRLGVLLGADLEVRGRIGFGGEGGLRLRSAGGRFRVAAKAKYLFAPYSLGGGGLEVGLCLRPGFMAPARLCTDLRATAFIFGDDLPENQVVAHIDLALGIEFDVL